MRGPRASVARARTPLRYRRLMQPGSVSGFSRTLGVLVVVAAAATATACGGGGGTTESIPLAGGSAGDDADGAAGAVQIHVPSGWYLGDMVATGAVPPGPETTLFLADESVVPRTVADAAAEDPASREEFSGHLGDGGLITIIIAGEQSCTGVTENLERRIAGFRTGVPGGEITEPDDTVGDEGTLVSGVDSGAALNAYSASLPLTSDLCRGLLISSTGPADQQDRLAEVVAEVARKSRLS